MDTQILFALKEKTREEMKQDGVITGSRILPDIPESQLQDVFFKHHPDIGILTHELEANHAGLHAYPHFEMYYVVSGQCRQKLDGGELITLHPGNFMILNPGSIHTCEILEPTDTVIVTAVRPGFFNAAFFSFFDSENSISDFFINYLMSTSTSSYMIFQNALNADTDRIMEEFIRIWFSNGPLATTQLKSLLILLFSQLLLNHPEDAANAADQEYAAIISYMTSHLQTASLKSTADHFHFHPNYLSAYIKKHSGRNFSSILTELRLVQAKYYLTGTDLPISQIVTLVGYQDQPSFNAMFRKNTGYTPSRFREMQKQG